MKRNNGMKSNDMVVDLGCCLGYGLSVFVFFYFGGRRWKVEKMNDIFWVWGGMIREYLECEFI